MPETSYTRSNLCKGEYKDPEHNIVSLRRQKKRCREVNKGPKTKSNGERERQQEKTECDTGAAG